MFEQYPGVTLLVFLIGLAVGVILTLLINKVRTGSASPVKLKREMEEYQDKVDTHFAETSKKFKQMTSQYQDLYQHLAEGATTLCRPDTIAADLIEGSSALQPKPAIEQKASSDKAAANKNPTKSSASNSNAKKSPQEKKPVANEKPTAGKTPADSKEPSANKEPSATKEPSIDTNLDKSKPASNSQSNSQSPGQKASKHKTKI